MMEVISNLELSKRQIYVSIDYLFKLSTSIFISECIDFNKENFVKLD